MNMESKIDQILKIVTLNQKDISELKRDVSVLKEDVAALKEDVAALKEDVAALKEDVATLKEDVAILKEEVEALKRSVTKLEKRVTSLERSVFLIETGHGDKIDALIDEMKVNEEAHKRIEESIVNLKSEIQGTLFNHEKRISKLEGNLVPSF